MHQAVLDFVASHRPRTPAGDVLDVGGRDVNGSPDFLFEDATSYTVVDLRDGYGVDLVGDICTMGMADVADVVLCLEVLEHAENWRDIVRACARACRHGGVVLITCAGEGRAPHSAVDGNELRDGEHYANVAPEALEAVMEAAGLDAVASSSGTDTRAYGAKRGPS